jgi:eukaryotic-like serine/threonine-protein kinase
MMTSSRRIRVVMGTLGYMAPEQVCAQVADFRADIFALGAVMFEMFTGKRAFQGATSADTLNAALNEEPSFSCLSGNATPGLQRVISRCLAKNPEGRFQSAADLALAIRSLTEFSVPQTSSLARNLHVHPWIKRSALLAIAVVLLTWRFVRSSDVVPIHSIVVLPFANASKDSEMDYLGEGLSEEITNSLSRLPDLKVMARSTVSHYKLRQDDPQGVGRDLRVDAVLTGRVREHGNELGVETELINVGTGTQLWGKRYRRSASDASLLQTAITRDLARYLRPQLSENQQEGLAKAVTKDAGAYQFYLRGRDRLESWTPEDLNAAAEFFEKAVAVDPNYAAAYAGLADAHHGRGRPQSALGIASGDGQSGEGLRIPRRRNPH